MNHHQVNIEKLSTHIMGVDEEIQNIYYSIYHINITLFNLDQGLGKALQNMDYGLSTFDHHVNEVVKSVNDVQANIVTQVKAFPNQWLYLTILLFVILLLLGLNAFLVYYIVKYVLNRRQRFDDYRMWYLKMIMRQKMRKADEIEEVEERGRSETPPPTYDELDEIYYNDEMEQDQTPILDSRAQVQYSTLI